MSSAPGPSTSKSRPAAVPTGARPSPIPRRITRSVTGSLPGRKEGKGKAPEQAVRRTVPFSRAPSVVSAPESTSSPTPPVPPLSPVLPTLPAPNLDILSPIPQRLNLSTLFGRNWLSASPRKDPPETAYIDPEPSREASPDLEDFANSSHHFDISDVEEEEEFESAQGSPEENYLPEDVPIPATPVSPKPSSSGQSTPRIPSPEVPDLVVTAPTTSPQLDRIQQLTQFGEGLFAQQQKSRDMSATTLYPPRASQREIPPHLVASYQTQSRIPMPTYNLSLIHI